MAKAPASNYRNFAGDGQRRTLLALEGAVQAGTRVVLLIGAPGSGRSTLLTMLADRLASAGYRIVNLSPSDSIASNSVEVANTAATAIDGSGVRTAVLLDDADEVPSAALARALERPSNQDIGIELTIVLVVSEQGASEVGRAASVIATPVEVHVPPVAADEVASVVADCVGHGWDRGGPTPPISDEAIERIARFGRGNLAVVRSLADAANDIAVRNQRAMVDGEAVAAALLDAWTRHDSGHGVPLSKTTAAAAEPRTPLPPNPAPISDDPQCEGQVRGNDLIDRWQRALDREMGQSQLPRALEGVADEGHGAKVTNLLAPVPIPPRQPPEPTAREAVRQGRQRAHSRIGVLAVGAALGLAVAGATLLLRQEAVDTAGTIASVESVPGPGPAASQMPPAEPAIIVSGPDRHAEAASDQAASAVLPPEEPASELAPEYATDPGTVSGTEFNPPAAIAFAAPTERQVDLGSPAVFEPAQTVLLQPSPATVREVQLRLRILGYRAGPIDGIEGPRTTAAVAAFESDSYLPSDGFIDDQMLSELRARTPDPNFGMR